MVREREREGWRVVWVEKAGAQQTNHDDGNQKKAKEIIQKVREIIDQAQAVEA